MVVRVVIGGRSSSQAETERRREQQQHPAYRPEQEEGDRSQIEPSGLGEHDTASSSSSAFQSQSLNRPLPNVLPQSQSTFLNANRTEQVNYPNEGTVRDEANAQESRIGGSPLPSLNEMDSIHTIGGDSKTLLRSTEEDAMGREGTENGGGISLDLEGEESRKPSMPEPSSSSSNLNLRASQKTTVNDLNRPMHRTHTFPERSISQSSQNDQEDPSSNKLHRRHRGRINPNHSRSKISNAFRSTNSIFSPNTGADPGVDVRREDPSGGESYRELKEPARVTVVDYDETGRGKRCDIPGGKLGEFLEGEEGQRREDNDEKGKKKRSVRWINVDGMNYDIIRTLGIKYDLHPLAIEDALRAPANPRSKVDFYANHLYAQILIQYTHQGDEDEIRESVGTNHIIGGGLMSGSGHGHASDDDEYDSSVATSSKAQSKPRSKPSILGRIIRSATGGTTRSLPDGVEGVFEPVQSMHPGHISGKGRPNNPHRQVIDMLSAKYMVPLRRSVMSVFVMRDGTMLSMSASPYSGILNPIYMRLENVDGLLRRTCDVSMLLEAVLDVVVDIAIEITQIFDSEILKMEAGCLVNPQMESVRHLHVLTSQLARLKRTLYPLMHVLYTLRDQDSQRALASMIFGRAGGGSGSGPGVGGGGGSASGMASGMGMGQGQHGDHNDHPSGMGMGMGTGMDMPPMGLGMGSGGLIGRPGLGGAESNGYISQTTKIYLSDVVDHLETVLSSLDQYIATCDHLTDYIFNMLSFITNASMERLSLVTVVFLPLTFLAGYFGMNFTTFDAIQQSDTYFWQIAAPLTIGFFVIFCFGYIKYVFERIVRIIGKKRREEMVRQESLCEKDVKRHRARRL